MAPDESERQGVLKAVYEVLELIEQHDGGGAVTARVRSQCSLLASGEVDILESLLAETTGGMGSLNDYGFGSDVDAAVRQRKDTLTSVAAEKCRVALGSRGIEPWR